MKPEIHDIECFLTVCKYMNFTSAGRELHFSQQAVSRIIRHLEDTLSVPLFRREKGGLELTEYGQHFYPLAKKLSSDYLIAMEDMSTYISHYENTLRIAIPRGLNWSLVREGIERFSSGHPEVAIHIVQEDDTGVEKLLQNGQADAGFCIAPVSLVDFRVHGRISGRTLYMVSEQNPLSLKTELTLTDLKTERFIGFGKSNRGHRNMNETCLAHGFVPRIFAEVNDLDMILSLVRENQGIGFYMQGPAQPALPAYPGIRLIPDAEALWDWELLLVTGKMHELRALDRDFLAEWNKA